MNKINQIHLPPSKNPENAPNPLDVTNGALVITGANGSGKTRLGTWLEMNSPLHNKVYRIAAQKSLTVPTSAKTGPMQDAIDALLSGGTIDQISQLRESNRSGQIMASKQNWRWGGKPNVSMLNDFQQLMDVLHSDAYETSTQYLSKSTGTASKIDPPETQLMKIKRLWEQVLPHRELDVTSINIKARIPSSSAFYGGGSMSDGERAIFYLLTSGARRLGKEEEDKVVSRDFAADASADAPEGVELLQGDIATACE